MNFSHQLQLMIFDEGLSDSKSPQVFRILFIILLCLQFVVVCMVSARPPISYSSSPLTQASKNNDHFSFS